MTFLGTLQKSIDSYKQGKTEDFITNFDQNMFNFTENVSDYNKKKIISLDFGKNLKIIEILDKILEYCPHDCEILARKAFVLELDGKIDEALMYIDKSLEICPDNIIALQTKGIINFNNENYESAIKCFDRVLFKNPKDTLSLLCKGLSLELLGKYQNSITCFSEVFDLDSCTDESIDRLGFHIVNFCGPITAESLMTQILITNPENKLALKIKNYLEKDQNKLRAKIFELYVHYLHRNPDPDELDYFEKHVIEGKTLEWVENEIKNSEEGKNYWN